MPVRGKKCIHFLSTPPLATKRNAHVFAAIRVMCPRKAPQPTPSLATAAALVLHAATAAACADTGSYSFSGALLPCTSGCSTTTLTCAQLAALGACEKHFGQVFDYSGSTAAPTCSQPFQFGPTIAVASGCCSTCNVDGLSAAEIDDMIKFFSMFDTNGDGSIDQSELKAVLHVSGADASDAQVATVLQDNDTNMDGRIEFTEFVGLMRQSLAAHPPPACVERSTTIAGQTLSCSHYMQLGYSCQALTTTPQFMNDFDCHCSCPGANSKLPTAPTSAKHCNAPALAAACCESSTLPACRYVHSIFLFCERCTHICVAECPVVPSVAADPSIMTADHLCDNICSAYMTQHWAECATDPAVDKGLIAAFTPVRNATSV